MRALKRGTIRTAFALLCVASWFVLTNHCALAQLASRPATVAGCPHCAHAGKPAPSTMGDCCRRLKVTSEGGECFQAASPFFAMVEYGAQEALVAPAVRWTAGAASGRGPPGSFVAVVLQRSLQAHAPPFLA